MLEPDYDASVEDVNTETAPALLCQGPSLDSLTSAVLRVEKHPPIYRAGSQISANIHGAVIRAMSIPSVSNSESESEARTPSPWTVYLQLPHRYRAKDISEPNAVTEKQNQTPVRTLQMLSSCKQ